MIDSDGKVQKFHPAARKARSGGRRARMADRAARAASQVRRPLIRRIPIYELLDEAPLVAIERQAD